MSSNVADKKAELREQLARAKTLPDAARAVREAIAARVAKSLQIDVSEIDEHRALFIYGIDSLVAVELSDWMFKQTKAVAPVSNIFASRPISDFALHLASKSQFVRAELHSYHGWLSDLRLFWLLRGENSLEPVPGYHGGHILKSPPQQNRS